MSPEPLHPLQAQPAPASGPPETPLDPGAQALADALRSSFFIVKIVMGILVVVFLASGFFTVGPQERAIVLRFGRTVGEGEKALLGPGPHWAFPYPIDEVVRVPIAEIQTAKSTAGWYYTTPEQELAGTEPFAGPSLNPAVDGYLITSDLNIVHARATMDYRIDDPVGCVLGFAGRTNGTARFDLTGTSVAVQNALDSALVETAATFTIDEILVNDVAGFKDAVQRRVVEVLALHGIGVTVDQVKIESRPPLSLKADFARVNQAVQQREQLLNEARKYENQTLSKAEAEAVSIVNLAQSERNRLVESIQADADRFRELLPNYRRNPELFVQLQLAEALSRALPGLQDTFYLQKRADGQPRELRLLLNRLPAKRQVGTTPAP